MVTKMEDRIKVDLATMSKMILDELRLCRPDSLSSTPDTIKRIGTQFNQGSLLQYHYGEIEKAEILCRGEIELFAQLSSHPTHKALCLAYMVQPYINLARIYGQKGEVRESLSIFEDIYRFGLQQKDLYIFGHHLSVTDAPAMFVAAPGYQRGMLACRVIDATRVLQTIDDYPALLALVETNAGLPEYNDMFFKQFLGEVRTRALLNLGQYALAAEALEECCRQMRSNAPDRIVIQSLLSQIYRQWGRDDLARVTLNKLEEHLARGEKFGGKLPILRQIAYRLALERYAMGDESKALATAEKAFKLSQEWNDQSGSVKSAILLLRLCTNGTQGTYAPAMQRQWFEELQRLASATLFRLERACGYWELGFACDVIESEGETISEHAGDFLLKSYNLYRSIPFVDSKQSCEAVKRSLDSWERRFPARSPLGNEVRSSDSSSIESVFDALMEHVPKSFVASQ